MRDNVPSPRYSAICNVLRQWKTSLIPTYRVGSHNIYNATTAVCSIDTHNIQLRALGINNCDETEYVYIYKCMYHKYLIIRVVLIVIKEAEKIWLC